MARSVDNTGSCESRTSSPVRDLPLSDHDHDDDDDDDDVGHDHDHDDDNNEDDMDTHDDDDDRQINLSMSITVPLCIKKTDTLKELKLACTKEGVSEQLLEHSFDKLGLNDDQTYGEAISAMSRRLFIKLPSDNLDLIKTTLIAKLTNSISTIITMARQKLGMEWPYYDLMYKGKYLKTHETLGSLNIPNNSTFYLVENPGEAITISVINPKRKPIKFQVKKIHTIWDAKIIVGCMINLDVENAVLMHEGCPIDELKSFDYFGFQGGTVFELGFPFEVFVKVLGGPKVTIEVLPCDCVEDLNQKTTKELRWTLSVYPFYFLGTKLQSGYNVAHYGIIEGCTLLMIPQPLD